MKTTTKRTPGVRQNDNQEPNSYGVRCFERPERPGKPFGVQWREDGNRKTEFFPTAEARDQRATVLRKAKRSGTVASLPSKAEIEEYRSIKAMLGDMTLQELAVLIATRPQAKTQTLLEPMIDAALARYQAMTEGDRPELAMDSWRHKRHKLAAFKEDFGRRYMEDITPAELTPWLEHQTGGTPGTFNNWKKQLSVFWKDFARHLKNPFDGVLLKKTRAGEVTILSVEQAKKLFRYGAEHARTIIPRIALEAFGGLRFGSAQRIEKSEVNVEDKGVTLAAHKIKTRRYHHLDGMPDNLWDWVALATDETWSMKKAAYMHAKSKLFTDAGVPHPRNCLRHSFCTYHVAAFRNQGLTARLLCHRDQQMLYDFYLGRASQSEGKAYFEIRP